MELHTEVRFRVSGREAELWYPESGSSETADYRFDKEKTTIPLQLTERQAVFVVFRKNTSAESLVIPPDIQTEISEVEGPWDISFPPGLGAPDRIKSLDLVSLTKYENDGIKYFSGTASYTTNVNISGKWLTGGAEIILDLGKVCDMAEVMVNGSPTDTLWLSPYRSDITRYVKKGENKIEVRVTNQWTNRLIGDRLAEPGKKVLNSTLFIRGGQPAESGLLGPVRIFSEKKQLP
jgi:hypothetical protein